MRIILLVSFIFNFLIVNGQDHIPRFELRFDGFVGLDSMENFIIMNVANKSKDDLFNSALTHFNSLYKNPKNVITAVDGESIVINASTVITKDDGGLYVYPMNYQFKIQFKDGRIRFEPIITELKEKFQYDDFPNAFYIANTDSPNYPEVRCIWMFSNKKNEYFLFREELKNNIDLWINMHVLQLSKAVTVDDW